MLRLVLKQTLAHRARLLLTFVAVTLGVTFVVGTLVLTDTSRKVFDDQFRDASSAVDVVVRDAVAFDAAMGVTVERDPLDPQVVERVEGVAGVGQAIPVVTGSGLLVTDGEAIVPAGPSVLSSWSGVDGFTLRSGAAPEAPDEVVLDVATASAHDIAIGDVVEVRAHHGAELEVVGLAGFGDADGLPDTTVALTSMATAQELLDHGDGISQVSVVAADGAATGELADRLRDVLGSSVDVSASQDTAAASADAAQAQLGYITTALLALAGAALVIGAFLIANTFSVLVTQRTRELAAMRAAGATGGQVLASILGEAVVLGLAGSAAGIGSGVLAARGLRELLAATGATVPDGPTVLAFRTLVVALAVGLVVTVLSALGAARRAARLSPVSALREGAGEGLGARRRSRPVLGTSSTVLGLLALAAGGAVQSTSALGVGVIALVAGLAALAPTIAPAAVAVVGRAVAIRRDGVPAKLARESARRAPRRTGTTVMALAMSLALLVFVSVVGASVRGALHSTYGEVITAELVVESARGEMLGGLERSAYDRVRDLPELETVSRLRYGHWKEAGATRALTALDPATIADVADIDMVEGDLADLADGGVAITEQQAADRGVDVGDTVSMTFARTGTLDVPIVGIVDDDDAKAMSTDYLVSLSSYDDWFTERVDATLLVQPADGVRAEDAETAVADAVGDMPTVDVRDQGAAAQARTASLDGILSLISAVLLLTVLIAMLGITNTLALSIIERIHELGLLRAVGMSRRQLSAMIRTEAILVAIASLFIGTGVGLGTAALFVRTMSQGGALSLTVPPTGLGLVATTALVVGVLAGIAPARRAARLEVLAAIRRP